MNDDKNRDWISKAARQSAMALGLDNKQTETLEREIRLHQPPIAEDVSSAEQQNIGSKLMAEQIAQSYLTGAGRFSFETEGDANWQINKMLDEIDSAKEQNKDTGKLLLEARESLASVRRSIGDDGAISYAFQRKQLGDVIASLFKHLQKLKEKI